MEKQDQDDLQGQNGGYAIFELLVHRFVVPYFHAQPCSDASAHKGHGQQGPFRYAPFCSFGLVLVQTIYEEGQDVDCEQEVCQEKVGGCPSDQFVHCEIFPERCGHHGLMELVVLQHADDFGLVQEYDFDVFRFLQMLGRNLFHAYGEE